MWAMWIEGWRSAVCYYLTPSGSVALPKVLLPPSVLLRGYAKRTSGRFHADYFADGQMMFRWASGDAARRLVRLENDVIDERTRRVRVYVEDELREAFAYRRVRLPKRSYGAPPVEADRDYLVMLATRPANWPDEVSGLYAKGWQPSLF